MARTWCLEADLKQETKLTEVRLEIVVWNVVKILPQQLDYELEIPIHSHFIESRAHDLISSNC